jgi:hypothetical protein
MWYAISFILVIVSGLLVTENAKLAFHALGCALLTQLYHIGELIEERKRNAEGEQTK